MATWIRQGTGTAPTGFNADLIGNYALNNATAPADFDPAGVTSVRTQWSVTGSGFGDDSWNNVSGCAVVTGATEISQHPGEGSTLNKNVVRSTDSTDSTGIPTGLSVADWEAAFVRGDGTLDVWCLWNKVMGPDGSTLTVSALTVTITYTPAVAGPNEGSASGTVGWAGSADGTAVHSGDAAGTVGWVGSADGVAPADAISEGSASGTIAWVGSVTGEAPTVGAKQGSADGTIGWVGAATGVATHEGSATGSLGWVGAAQGEAPTVGVEQGSASGAVDWAGAATGTTTREGSSTGTLGWAGSAAGEAPTVGGAGGAGVGVVSWTGAATGASVHQGAATGTLVSAGTADGITSYAGSAIGTVTWEGEATSVVSPPPRRRLEAHVIGFGWEATPLSSGLEGSSI